MSEFKSEKKSAEVRMSNMASPKPAPELSEIVAPGDKKPMRSIPMLDYKARLAAIKAKAAETRERLEREKNVEEKTPAETQAEKRIVELADGVNEQQDLEKRSQIVLNAEAMFYEMIDSKIEDTESYRQVFMRTIDDVAGKQLSLDAIKERIVAAHKVLFDTRGEVQALLAYRAEMLKDASAEEQKRRMKEDFAFPVSRGGNGKAASPKKAKSPKASFDPFAAMRQAGIDALLAKGVPLEKAQKLVAAKLEKFGK